MPCLFSMSGASPGDGCDKLTKDSCLGSLISVRFAGVGMSKMVLSLTCLVFRLGQLWLCLALFSFHEASLHGNHGLPHRGSQTFYLVVSVPLSKCTQKGSENFQFS